MELLISIKKTTTEIKKMMWGGVGFSPKWSNTQVVFPLENWSRLTGRKVVYGWEKKNKIHILILPNFTQYKIEKPACATGVMAARPGIGRDFRNVNPASCSSGRRGRVPPTPEYRSERGNTGAVPNARRLYYNTTGETRRMWANGGVRGGSRGQLTV